jgi:hypothetical protein
MPIGHRAVVAVARFVRHGSAGLRGGARLSTRVDVASALSASVNWVLIVATAFVLLELVFHQLVLAGCATGTPRPSPQGRPPADSAATPATAGAETRPNQVTPRAPQAA